MKAKMLATAVFAAAILPGLASAQCYGNYRTQVGGVIIYSTAPPSVFYVGQTPYYPPYGVYGYGSRCFYSFDPAYTVGPAAGVQRLRENYGQFVRRNRR